MAVSAGGEGPRGRIGEGGVQDRVEGGDLGLRRRTAVPADDVEQLHQHRAEPAADCGDVAP